MRIPVSELRAGVLIFFVLLSFCGLASATEYYVSTSGKDSNNGTLNYPWLSPSKISGLAQFDTLNIAEGSYSGGLAIPQDNITVIGTGSVWLNGTGTEKALEINYKDNLTLENINFFNYDSGVQEVGSDTLISNCSFGNFTGSGTGYALYLDGHAYILSGLKTKPLSNVTFSGCKFYNCDTGLTGVANMINIDGANLSASEPITHNINFLDIEIYGTASHQLINLKNRNTGNGVPAFVSNGLTDVTIDGLYIHNITSKSATYPNAIFTTWGQADNLTFKNATIDGLQRYAIVGNYVNSIFENVSVKNTGQDYSAIFLDDQGFSVYPVGTKFINVSTSGNTFQNRIIFDSPLGLINYVNNSNSWYYESKANMTVTSPVNSSFYIQAKGNGSVALSYPDGMVISATLTSANAPYVFSSPSYTPTGTVCSLTQQTGGTTSSTARIITYNYSAKPSTGTATVIPNSHVGNELANFTAESTNGNSVTFTLWGLTPGYQYRINEDGSQKSTQLANETGMISWTNSAWSEHVYTVEDTGLRLPVAAFTANVTGGTAPKSIQFTDASTQNPTSWSWDFNGDSVEDSTEQNPVWTYSTDGTYTVSLTVSNAIGSDTETKTGYIILDNPPYVPIIITTVAAAILFMRARRRW